MTSPQLAQASRPPCGITGLYFALDLPIRGGSIAVVTNGLFAGIYEAGIQELNFNWFLETCQPNYIWSKSSRPFQQLVY